MLKSDFAAGILPSGRIGSNAAWLQAAAITLNVVARLRVTAMGGEWLRVRMKRLRAIWLHHVGIISRRGRRTTLFLPAAAQHLVRALDVTALLVPEHRLSRFRRAVRFPAGRNLAHLPCFGVAAAGRTGLRRNRPHDPIPASRGDLAAKIGGRSPCQQVWRAISESGRRRQAKSQKNSQKTK